MRHGPTQIDTDPSGWRATRNEQKKRSEQCSLIRIPTSAAPAWPVRSLPLKRSSVTAVRFQFSSRPNRDEVQRRPTIDLEAAELAAQDLLTALGANLEADGLRETPRRIARAYAEMLTPTPFNMTTFPNEEGYDELLAVRGVPFQSLCMHHRLPFHGIAHVAYLPNEHIVGLSKLGRVVDLFSRDLQLQERLTTQVADWLDALSAPKGVGVIIAGRAPLHVPARCAKTWLTHCHLGLTRLGQRRSQDPSGVSEPRSEQLTDGGKHGSSPIIGLLLSAARASGPQRGQLRRCGRCPLLRRRG